MIGSINPIPELVVAPRIVIASPMFGIARERKKLTKTRIKVTNTFCLELNLVSGSKNNSSIVSLHGRIVKGVANKITVRIPKRDI